jgi:single-strand DNA-binding protein
MYQQVIIVGNVGGDVKIDYPQGIPVAKFNVAVNKVTGKGDARQTKTTWFRCSVWRERAETAAQYIKKGMKIMVIGEVNVNAYIDKNGQAQATLDLTANEFKFLDSRDDNNSGGGGGGDYSAAPQRNSSGNNNYGGNAESAEDIPF